ncbi:MAG: DUF2550 family protein [Microthrixaceae bacterium]|nr:DUF2550 family protein [Microthrixaceae bacterium]
MGPVLWVCRAAAWRAGVLHSQGDRLDSARRVSAAARPGALLRRRASRADVRRDAARGDEVPGVVACAVESAARLTVESAGVVGFRGAAVHP